MQRLLRNKWFYIGLAALAVGWWWFSGSGGAGGGGAAPVRVTVAPVIRQDVPIRVELVGTAIAYETVAVKSRLDSQVKDVKFKDGDSVIEGQVLFDLDDRTILAQIKELEAGVEKEQAQLVNAKLQYDRALKLAKSNTVAQSQVDAARAVYQGQVAQVNAVQAMLDTARVQLTYTVITAPIGGRAGTINVTRGNTVRANDTQPLVTINQVRPIRAQFSIPQRYYDQVRNAMSESGLAVAARRGGSQDEAAKGALEYLDNAIDTGSGTFAARAVFANEDEKLWPGMFVNVTLELGIEKNALTIPAVAVQGDEDNHFVFALADDGKKAVRTPIKIEQNNGDMTIVEEGISEGDRVIIDGLLRITDGGPVEVVEPGATDGKQP